MNDKRPSYRERSQQNVDDIVGMLGSERGMWLIGGLLVLGLIAAGITFVDLITP